MMDVDRKTKADKKKSREQKRKENVVWIM